jgi:hypothetical protein
MSTEQHRDDETLPDLPEPAVTDSEAETIKGGATDPRVAAPTSPLPTTPTRPIIPKAIDPCW